MRRFHQVEKRVVAIAAMFAVVALCLAGCSAASSASGSGSDEHHGALHGTSANSTHRRPMIFFSSRDWRETTLAPVPLISKHGDDESYLDYIASETATDDGADQSDDYASDEDYEGEDDDYVNPYDAIRDAFNESDTDGVTDTSREIVCWGDSITEGFGSDEAVLAGDEGDVDISYVSYPEVLQALTGIKTYNFGVSGATTVEIDAMEGAYNPADYADEISIFDETVAAMSPDHLGNGTGDVLILLMGSNGGWDSDYPTLVKQYRDLLDHSGCTNYIIMGDVDDPGLSLGDLNQRPFDPGEGPGETDWEAVMQKEFGNHFINMRAYLIENGMEICGLTETPIDLEEESRGCIPTSLRSDWTHLNAYGYYAQAIGLYEKGIELGYWE